MLHEPSRSNSQQRPCSDEHRHVDAQDSYKARHSKHKHCDEDEGFSAPDVATFDPYGSSRRAREQVGAADPCVARCGVQVVGDGGYCGRNDCLV
ncbi:hypothetical protein RJZ56_008082 [Blastomyces dermatitidis]